MPSINVTIDGLSNIDKMIKKINQSKKVSDLNNYLKNKVVETYIKVMSQELTGGTTNDQYISLYKKSYHLEDTDNGFILYNNALISQSDISAKNKQSYPKGFSIAMAFEYGVGIVGISTGNPNAWNYNVHQYEDGWKYVDKNGIEQFTAGHRGFEIFRKTVEQVDRNLNDWIDEYYRKERV